MAATSSADPYVRAVVDAGAVVGGVVWACTTAGRVWADADRHASSIATATDDNRGVILIG